MKYFAVMTSRAAELLAQLHASTQVSLNEAEAARERMRESGFDPDLYGISDLATERDRTDAAVQQAAQQEAERRAALSEIGFQATRDAHTAWDRGDTFFAPILCQPLGRLGVDWETALTQITEIGWRLNAWQVIGPAPEPFDRVTLIQTLFER